MSPHRFAAVFMLALLFVPLAASGPCLAQQDPEGLQARLRRLLDQNAGGGTPIEESQMIWAYAAAVGGFIVLFALTWVLVKVIACLVIIVSFLGGIASACWFLHEHWITSWQQLGWVLLSLGISAGITAITANLFLLSNGSAASTSSDLTAQQAKMQETIDRLTREVEALKSRAR